MYLHSRQTTNGIPVMELIATVAQFWKGRCCKFLNLNSLYEHLMQVSYILDVMGERSSKAQGLKQQITSGTVTVRLDSFPALSFFSRKILCVKRLKKTYVCQHFHDKPEWYGFTGPLLCAPLSFAPQKNVDKKYFRRKRNLPLNLVLVVLVKTHLGRHFVTFFFTKSFNNDSQNDSGVDNSGGVSLFFFSRMSQK